jgi:Transposase
MKNRRHTPEQIVRKLREADRLLGEGVEPPEVMNALEVAEATYHRWRAQYGGIKTDMRTRALVTPNHGFSFVAVRRDCSGVVRKWRSA